MTSTSADPAAAVESAPALQGYLAIPELIRRSGTGVVFSMLGETNVPWIAAGADSGAFRFVRTRHEATSVSAAAGFSRTTGAVGIASVTRGPGFANAVNALKAATHDHVPLLLIVAESPATRIKISPFYQNLDQRGITAALGAGFHHVANGSQLEETFWAAYRGARWNGLPQVLSVADGVIDDPVRLGPTPELEREAELPDPESVTAIVDVLEGARRPLVLAGQGAVHADCRAELEQLADLIGARVASTLNVNRYFSGHPHNLGVCGHSSPTLVADLISQSDVVVAVGASLNPYTTGKESLFTSATIVQVEIDVDQPFHASRAELGLLSDAREGVRALIAEWRRRGLSPRPVEGTTPSRAQIAASVADVDLGHDADRGIDLRRAFAVLDARLPADRIVISDSGRWSGTLPTFLDARDGRSWVISRGYGSIGLGLGNAIGAAAGNPDRPVVLFCGDGGFMMSSHDVDAIRLNDLDLTVFIVNDEAYGAEVPYLTPYGLPADVARQNLPDMVAYAQAFGARGVVVRTLDELEALELSPAA
ncbi:thiamine pyrophosphate-binding protein [Nocardioides humi]|uniref:thiamine pyrophosphate-binding protein n=1 Tax=Nocardioides humi TaxID=449461 RepID=UPI00112625D8|nr:thiamine pyrophosphate-binding protein [Nocardioides humi]